MAEKVTYDLWRAIAECDTKLGWEAAALLDELDSLRARLQEAARLHRSTINWEGQDAAHFALQTALLNTKADESGPFDEEMTERVFEPEPEPEEGPQE